MELGSIVPPSVLQYHPQTSRYLVFEVCVVLEDGPLVGSGPNVVLHHVLLLGEVAIELQDEEKEEA